VGGGGGGEWGFRLGSSGRHHQREMVEGVGPSCVLQKKIVSIEKKHAEKLR
jgi:hypothetical protein